MEMPKEKKIGGGSFIASGVFTTLTPAIFYVVLGDFFLLLKDCSLPYSTIDIGKATIVNCSEIRLVAVLSYISVFIGIILVIWGLARKIVDYKEKSDMENKRRTKNKRFDGENRFYIKPLIKEVRPKVREKKIEEKPEKKKVKIKPKINKSKKEIRFERSGI